MSIGAPAESLFVSASVAYNRITPFLVDQPVIIDSAAGTTLYGANHPGKGSVTKYARFIQSLTGNKAFTLPSTIVAPLVTSGGAVTAANQLRNVCLVTDVVQGLQLRGDNAATAGSFIVGASGGTAIADATLSVNGVNAVGATTLSYKSSGADVNTFLPGDALTLAGDTTVYYATATLTTTNGVTPVSLAITPPLQKATAGNEVITVVSGAGKVFILGTAPVVGAIVECFALAATDVITITGGAMTAGRKYVVACNTFFHTAGAVNVAREIN